MLKNNVEMSMYSSMKTGGIAKKCYFPESIEELCDVLKTLKQTGEKHYVLGNMSNVLIPDGEIPFVPVITTKINSCKITENEDGTVSVYAESGAMLTKTAYEMCKAGYSGMEFAYGIPGTVGGAVFMNAGAYGSEIANIAEYVDCYDVENDSVIRISAKDCNFGYRSSAFQNNGYVILGCCFALSKGNVNEIVSTAKEIMQKRIDKQPLEYPSCGSTFKRPEGYFAGDLIERSGLKGCSIGGACVSEKHAGFIINRGGATTEEVLALIEHVKSKVKENFDVELDQEIRVLE